jgi:nucleotidyltransferase substrate binding protein (TIGR01987 family)
MTNPKEIRYKQRFIQFEKAFLLLEESVQMEEYTKIERAGLIQFFEITFELSWKLLKDYLESSGYLVKSPRDAIKKAFQVEIIQEGHHWIDALDDRNITVHTYNEELAEEIRISIKEKYFPIIKKLYNYIKETL